MKKTWISLVCFIVLVAGCGYTTGSLLPSRFQTIYVEPFKNSVDFSNDTTRDLYVPLLEIEVREAVSNRFMFDGNLRPGTAEDADITLSGELLKFERGDLRLDSSDNVQEYRLHVVMKLTMIDNLTGEVMWSSGSFAGETTYFVSGPNAISESAAIDEAIEDLARRIVERTIEDW